LSWGERVLALAGTGQGGHLAVTAAVLAAAVLHAAWNALAARLPDKLAGLGAIGLAQIAAGVVGLVAVPAPAGPSRPFVVGSSMLHVSYDLLLLNGYRVGELSQVYPLARGLAPLLVAGAAAVVAGERLGPAGLAGVALVCLGLVSLTLAGGWPSRQDRPALAFAAATGVAIAAYTVTDGLGVRQAGSALGYIVWLNFFHGLGMVACAAAYRRRALPAGVRRAWPAGVVIMVLSSLAYGLVLWAQQRGALAAVAALRETSVLLAAAIGTVLFKERFGRVRMLAAALVTAGIVLTTAQQVGRP
jgi:drug/metabolite transporter (DMT)-like permease